MAASSTRISDNKEKDKDAQRKAKQKKRRRAWFEMARALLIGQKKT
ncbi:MAG TPA: hypothetical protein VJR58_34310 [Vineibacter sp.]|nr:hypothetical protein [Vineibacter sp.]